MDYAIGAQRLSASEIQHPKFAGSAQSRVYVLNAFRHQRFNTEKLDNKVVVEICAQRLSASEIQHTASFWCWYRLLRAQRLSASEIQHQSLTRSLAPKNGKVLNAFRHQRFNTSQEKQVSIGKAKVLNAFRHQRFNTTIRIERTNAANSAQRLSASEIQHLR